MNVSRALADAAKLIPRFSPPSNGKSLSKTRDTQQVLNEIVEDAMRDPESLVNRFDSKQDGE